MKRLFYVITFCLFGMVMGTAYSSTTKFHSTAAIPLKIEHTGGWYSIGPTSDGKMVEFYAANGNDMTNCVNSVSTMKHGKARLVVTWNSFTSTEPGFAGHDVLRGVTGCTITE